MLLVVMMMSVILTDCFWLNITIMMMMVVVVRVMERSRKRVRNTHPCRGSYV